MLGKVDAQHSFQAEKPRAKRAVFRRAPPPRWAVLQVVTLQRFARPALNVAGTPPSPPFPVGLRRAREAVAGRGLVHRLTLVRSARWESNPRGHTAVPVGTMAHPAVATVGWGTSSGVCGAALPWRAAACGVRSRHPAQGGGRPRARPLALHPRGGVRGATAGSMSRRWRVACGLRCTVWNASDPREAVACPGAFLASWCRDA